MARQPEPREQALAHQPEARWVLARQSEPQERALAHRPEPREQAPARQPEQALAHQLLEPRERAQRPVLRRAPAQQPVLRRWAAPDR